MVSKTVIAAVLAAGFMTTFAAAPAGAQTLAAIKGRGYINCGSVAGAPGFAIPDKVGEWSGLNIDYCRALSAAVFDDPAKIKVVPLSSKERFTALQSATVDVLVNNSTWTLSRDSALGLDFPAINFYDGQAFMVRKKMGVKSATELAGATVCVAQGTTTELNLADFFRARGLKYEVVSFGTDDEAVQAYDAGRCDSYTNDASGTYSYRLKLAQPDDHVVLPEIISKEPLASVVRQGDAQWEDIVRWTHFAMITAEELGVTKANLSDMMKSENPDIKRLVGTEGNFGEAMGLTKDWAARIVRTVGNYGESFERNVGMASPLKIARGQNALWNKGGQQYAPPIR